MPDYIRHLNDMSLRQLETLREAIRNAQGAARSASRRRRLGRLLALVLDAMERAYGRMEAEVVEA